jgi:hypothetical protein
MGNFVELTFEEWVETYKPIINHIDTNASFDGLMFETYGDEVEFVKQAGNGHIWMYGDGDDGGSFIWNGWGFVNRIGYFITEIPFSPDDTIQVKVSIPFYFCENCDSEWEDEDNLISDMFWELQKCPTCATLEEITQLESEQE